MRIKIVGDGTSWYTRVLDAATGDPLEGVTRIVWCLDARQGLTLATATITVSNVPIDVEAEAAIVPAKE